MERIKEYIKEKRPNLGTSSIVTYGSIIKNIYKKVFGNDEVDFKRFDDTNAVLEYLKDIPPNRRKTILSALVIVTNQKAYRDLMLEDVKDYNTDINKQEKTPEQIASWVDCNQIKDIYNDLKNNAELIYKKKIQTISDLQQIQNFIILSLLGGLYIPPRRSKDFCDFKIKNFDKTTDNYLEKNKMIFNSYKTSKTYGTQEVDIPIQLKNILTKWIKINPTDYLLFDTNMSKLSSVKLNQRLNKIFGEKKVGCNQLRHTYLTDKYGDTIKTKNAIANTMTEMASSPSMLNVYVKKD
jgi:integrase